MIQKKRYRSIFKLLNQDAGQYSADAAALEEDEDRICSAGALQKTMTITPGKRFKISISPTQRQHVSFPKLQISQQLQSPRNAGRRDQRRKSAKIKSKENINGFNTSLDDSIQNYFDDFPSSGESVVSSTSLREARTERLFPSSGDSDADTLRFCKTWNEFLSLSATLNGSLNESNSIDVSKSGRELNCGRCRKNGYLKELKQAIDATIRDTKFLKHDKRLGLREGFRMIVIKIEEAFGIHSAEVRFEGNSNFCDMDVYATFHVVLDEEQAKTIKAGNEIEGFFDNDYYVLPAGTNRKRIVYIQPEYLFIIK